MLGESKATSGRNIVEAESADIAKNPVKAPVCSLTFGETEMVCTGNDDLKIL